MDYNWKISIRDVGYKSTRDIFVYRRGLNGKTEIMGVGEVDEGAGVPKPTLELEPEQLQAFADALNEQGYKPQKGFLEGKLEATERHLADIRKLLKLK